MGIKIILVLVCVILALICAIVIMGNVIRSKNRKISSLSQSIERQRTILEKINGVKQTAKKEQKIISSGSVSERFENSLKVLKSHKKKDGKEDSK